MMALRVGTHFVWREGDSCRVGVQWGPCKKSNFKKENKLVLVVWAYTLKAEMHSEWRTLTISEQNARKV